MSIETARQSENRTVPKDSHPLDQFLKTNGEHLISEEITPESLKYQAMVLASNFYQGSSSRRIREVLGNLTGDPDNPWLALRKMTDNEFKLRASANGFAKSLPILSEDFEDYISGKEGTWFEKTTLLSPKQKEYLRQHPISSSGLEIAINTFPQIYSGGLGLLNGDEAREESDMGLPTIRHSLLYRGGYFKQKIIDGCQVEDYYTQDGKDYPLSEAKDIHGKPIGLIKIPMGKNHEVFAKVWRADIGRVPVYLYDTYIPENENHADKWITGHLYSGADKDTRIRQEILLGIGTVRAEKAMGIEPSMHLLQEGHAAFVVFEVTAGLVEKGIPLEKALWKAMDTLGFTDHTIVIDEFFPKELLDYYVDVFARRMSTPKHTITTDELYELGKDDQGRFSMTMLALISSAKKNGVSEIHTKVLREKYPDHEIESITNGVHIGTWLGEPTHDLLDKHLGKTWKDNLDNKERFNMIQNIPDGEVWDAHMEQKRRFINYANNKYGCNFSPDIITACLARRFAGYKRNGLLFRDRDKLAATVGNDKRPMQIFIGGKAHPSDLENKLVIKYINDAIKDPRLKGRIVFVDEYDKRLAERLVSGVDLWMNFPRRKKEASGTSGMKAGINGVLHLSELDGWWNEAYSPDKGWAIGRMEDDATKMSDAEIEVVDRRDAEEIYETLQESIVPTYYLDRSKWIARMKNTMIDTLTNYSTRRMVMDKIRKIYLPIIDNQLMQVA